MTRTVSLSDFRQAFRDYGRENQFSYEALKALYEYLEELESCTDIAYELDVIALCCEFCEYTAGEACEAYDLESLEELEENTTVIYIDKRPRWIGPDDREEWEDTPIIIANF